MTAQTSLDATGRVTFVLATVVLVIAGVVGYRSLASSAWTGLATRAGSASEIDKLDPDLAVALDRATKAAERDGTELVVNSGWRSAEQQQRLFDEAVTRYGSAAEARRWVAPPESSSHVAGDAVDIGPPKGATWLGEYGASYGLCRVYANEPWHFELRPEAVDHGCPATYADASQDPRLNR